MFRKKSRVAVVDLGTLIKYHGFGATYRVIDFTLSGGSDGDVLQLNAVSEEKYHVI